VLNAEYIVWLPYEKPPLTLNQRLHWRAQAKLKADLRHLVYDRLIKQSPTPAGHIRVELHYVPRDRRRRDQDNLVPTLKSCLDGIVDTGLIPDDTPDYVTWTPPVIDTAQPTNPHMYLRIIVTEDK